MLSGCWLPRPGGLSSPRWMRTRPSNSKPGSGGRGKARPENQRAALKAEAFEESLSRVSRRVAALARQSAAELRAERIAAARAAKQGQAPGTRRAAPATGPKGATITGEPTGDRALRSPVMAKRRASTRASGARRQAKRDSR